MTVVGNAAEYADVQAAVDATLKAFGRLDRDGADQRPRPGPADLVWAVRQPDGVDVNTVVVRPIGQPN
ncbi:hypothetical protein AQJ67_03480 [Streptomyces caeruleatus]|uniref:Uncharacterized protein n=1 Tax=Streptomyces caeruleatus TaxID=661399 RepID=A0A101U894_9ACTN|nr:hypothetical protein AQJ67_03480 [Streptomyces caeruleatus]